MSLNIFIDVDGTLLNSNEGVDPRAQEILRQIRLKLNAEYPDSGLYLWSGAGGDYARSKAEEHGLAGFFSGFVGKPDVIIDDNPSSVLPQKIITWCDDSQWQSLKSSVFAEFSPSNQLIELVDDTINTVENTDGEFSCLYGECKLRCPIPFFGDVENAEVLTLAVNPSDTEFYEDREWKRTIGEVTDSKPLSFRLVNYFRSWRPPPNAWFTPLETKLRLRGCSYLFNSAHIDLSPRATRKMSEFENDPKKFRKMIYEDASRWIIQLLNLAKRLKQIRLCRTVLSENPGGRVLIGSYIRDELPEIWQQILKYNPEII